MYFIYRNCATVCKILTSFGNESRIDVYLVQWLGTKTIVRRTKRLGDNQNPRATISLGTRLRDWCTRFAIKSVVGLVAKPMLKFLFVQVQTMIMSRYESVVEGNS